MDTYTYSSQDVSITIGGSEIKGYAKDTFVSLKQLAPTSIPHVTSDGVISRTIRQSNCYIFEVELMQTSDSNALFAQMTQLDRASKDFIFPIFIKDHSTGSSVFSLNSWMAEFPNSDYGSGMNTRKWKMCLADPVILLGGGGGTDVANEASSILGTILPSF